MVNANALLMLDDDETATPTMAEMENLIIDWCRDRK